MVLGRWLTFKPNRHGDSYYLYAYIPLLSVGSASFSLTQFDTDRWNSSDVFVVTIVLKESNNGRIKKSNFGH